MGQAKMSWHEVLGLVKSIAPEEGWAFTTTDLVNAGVDPKHAAKWVSKFVDWGYIRRGDFIEKTAGGRGRPQRVYHMLKRGKEKDVTTISRSDLDRLIDAVEILQTADDEKAQATAYQDLIQTKDAILDERKKRLEKKPLEKKPKEEAQ